MSGTPSVEMERRLSHLHQRLEDIREIAWSITSCLHLEQILAALMEAAIRTVGAEVGGIFQRTDDRVNTRTAWGLDSDTVTRLQVGEVDPVTRVYSTGGVVEADESSLSTDDSRLHVRSLLALPIVARDEMCGVLVLVNGPEEGAFSTDARDTAALLVAMAAVAIQNARLLQEEVQRQKLNQQLAVARTVQSTLLPVPATGPAPVRWQAYYLPACDVGGDYYDVIQAAGNRWVLAIGDVSDHGIAAALLMTAVRSVVRSFAGTEPDTATVMARVNATLCDDFARQDGMFVTLCLLGVDPGRHRLTYTNAGHPAPLYWDMARLVPAPLTTGGPILGQFPEARYGQSSLELGPSWRILAYTDGVTETASRRGDLYGTARVRDYAARQAWTDPGDFLRGLREDLEQYSGGPRCDDTTLLWVGEGAPDGRT